MEKVLKVKDVAKLLGVTEHSIRQRVWKNQIPARKLGRTLVFVESELEEFIKNLPKRWQDKEEKNKSTTTRKKDKKT